VDCSVADPGPGAFFTLDPRSRIPDPKPIFLIATNFWIQVLPIILSASATKIFFTCSKIKFLRIYDIYGYKKGRTKKFFPYSFGAVVGSGIQDG
jgi:hypothetical protein